MTKAREPLLVNDLAQQMPAPLRALCATSDSLNVCHELSGESTRRGGSASVVPRDRIELSTPAFSGRQVTLKFQHLRISTFHVRLPQNNSLHDGMPQVAPAD